jgi:uncharacterized membrane protein
VALYDWLLFLHVLAAASMVASVVLFTFLIVKGWNLEVPSDVVRIFRLSKTGDVLVAVGAIGVLVLGIWLAIEVEGYEIWDGWIVAAIVLWIFLGAVGNMTGKVYYAARDRARALAAEGDAPSPELNAMLRSSRGLALHAASVVFTLAILVDMIYKPGA